MPTRLRIFHETRYHYSEPVVLGSHKLLVRPRDGHDLRIESSRLDISPSSLISWHRDELDNSVALVTFEQTPTTFLNITSEVEVSHYLSQRSQLPLLDHVNFFPFSYSEHEQALLSAYFGAASDPVVDNWLAAHTAGNNGTIALLTQLSDSIFNDCLYQARDEEGVQAPAETLTKRIGSCRDYAWLFVIATRKLGFASRFVSGYFHTAGTALADGTTHAWAEVYLPGAGWTGFDPTANRIVAENHIPVAMAINPIDIPPVSGHFTASPNVATTLEVKVNVNQIETG